MSGTGTSSRARALPYSCIRAAFMSASFPALVRKVPSPDVDGWERSVRGESVRIQGSAGGTYPPGLGHISPPLAISPTCSGFRSEPWRPGRTRPGSAGDQLAVGDGVNAPVLDLGKGGAEAHQFVLDEEGNHLRQAHLFLLTIGEAGHVLALDERLAFRGRDMAQHAGSVAAKRNGFAGSEERFDQLD